MLNKTRFYLSASLILLLTACSGELTVEDGDVTINTSANTQETPKEFVDRVNKELVELYDVGAKTAWIAATYITDDTQALEAASNEKFLAFNSKTIEQTKSLNLEGADAKTLRAINLIKVGSSLPAPNDEEQRAELAKIMSSLGATYGKGKYCPDGEDSCLSLGDLSRTLANSRDYDEQLEAWKGWRTISPVMKKDYARFVELTNAGAKELGYANTGDVWKGGYDMTSAEFEAESERLWNQVKPLYDELHCYVRDKLADTYGENKVSRDGPMPAHLMGNMWSQQWAEIYDLVEPYPGVAEFNVTSALEAMPVEGKTERAKEAAKAEKMVRMAEDFFTSLDLPALPESFYEKSLFLKPRDRDVVCHASAWPMDQKDDVRIKMCITPTAEEFTTIHHELGHIYYYLMQQDLPPLFKAGAHDGFHEGIGDTLTLSMTPDYLKQIGLVETVEKNEKAVINQQMKLALDKIAFLPFSKLVDQWRWDVFAGKTTPDTYNTDWWKLRTKYQGIVPPVERTEADFDPGAKYHIPGNTPYTRYFLAHILQFQFHKSLCETAGHEGPLYECSIFGNKDVGKRLGDMLAMGASEPWPNAMQAITGERDMDGSAIIEYFAPLMGYLKEENAGKTCGW
ncbi:MAG: M2 family metallopeptidase [Gammaproteobacteria bacterium]|nr:M2 family metallopeptidase [Gammaproteobacteria bacterium]